MARCHNLVVDTKALLTRKKTDKHFSEDWFDEARLGDFDIKVTSAPELTEQTDETETVRVDISVQTFIVTSDDEYRVYKLIYWDPNWEHDNIKINILYDDFFELIDDDSWWIDDEDLEFQ